MKTFNALGIGGGNCSGLVRFDVTVYFSIPLCFVPHQTHLNIGGKVTKLKLHFNVHPLNVNKTS
jgi:hypothetical protein